MSEPKLHHYLPKAYLDGFTDPGGDLWVIDRKSAQVRPQRPEVTAAERELYSLDLDERKERSAEKILASTIDGPGIGAIQALGRGDSLNEDQTSGLAHFVAALLVRTPAAKAMHSETWSDVHALMTQWGDMGGPPTEEDRASLPPGGIMAYDALQGIEEMRNQPRPFQNTFVRMLAVIPELARAILGLEWLIAVAPPKKTFVTCDNPVLFIPPVGHPAWRGVGLATPGAEKMVPLSQHIALLMWNKSDSARIRVGVMDPDRLRGLNEALTLGCQRFACGSSQPLMQSLMKRTRVGGTPSPRRGGIHPPPLTRPD